MKSRRERRAEARRFGLDFQPQYAKGNGPMTYLQAYGVGYERFDTKFVKVSGKVENQEVE
jgi:hypothetical protein